MMFGILDGAEEIWGEFWAMIIGLVMIITTPLWVVPVIIFKAVKIWRGQ